MSDMIVLCECGCGQPAPISPRTERARGYVRGKPRRFVHGHQGQLPADRKFITPDKYRVAHAGCWEWIGYVRWERDGYGIANQQTAHRQSYIEHVGPIPDGYHIDHLCRNRRCVNPAHLEAVTSKENHRRGNMGKKLNRIQARSIAADERLGYVIAADYGVTPTIVSRIKSGKAWSRATGIAPNSRTRSNKER